MINLFDHYNQASWDLHFSLLKAGYRHPTVVIVDDGFLPEDVTSPYLFFTGFANASGKPRYFNDLVLPRFWEIRATNQQAEVYNFHEKKATIHYWPAGHNRLIQSVDWLDSKGRVRWIDRYNRFGYRFAQTSINEDGEWLKTSYYNRDGKEVILENHVTGDLLLTYQDKHYIFHQKQEFIHFYLKQAGFTLDRIFYNSLSTPFFLTLLVEEKGSDILFWQEPIIDGIPGNMQGILKGGKRETKILVQDQATYQKLLALLPPESKATVDYLGLQYPFKEKQVFTPEALLLTNSDQLEQVEVLLQALPELIIHIAAVTEMSSKLLSLSRYPNVRLYPNVTVAKAQELLRTTSFYFDINHHSEILSAVRAAFEYQSVILAFDNTIHDTRYVASKHCFSPENTGDFIACVKSYLAHPEKVEEGLNQQKKQANTAESSHYQLMIGEVTEED
ncbi:accessory Sec system glycosylation chaperone GtfB [Streptococcus himalayensis]|uniref:UDP-N-acetylglucosamine--peptide N-acetylglucosaminyltransferase stabilizing protein GtfB n=1 Tax=Streptococcus himalayensis TaxID=1888195 RepID=A0A917A7N8_9STRE|nr:accessory Sec system glycosylation chaperone GtfB [Streptococcus himalayensis]GGE33699.1 glycosyltransferase stabilizing protein Gtf2 [Streptococcus himalayensis]